MSQFRPPQPGHQSSQEPDQTYRQSPRPFLQQSQPDESYTRPEKYYSLPTPPSPNTRQRQLPPSIIEQQNKQDVSLISGIIGVIVVLAIIAGIYGINNHNNSSVSQQTSFDQTTPIDQSTPISQPTAAPGWTILQTYAGSGPKKTDIVKVPNHWRIVWACYGMAGGYDGALSVQVMGADNSYVDASAVDVNCKAGTTTTDFTEEHQGGQVYLNMIAAGDWTVEVQIPNQ